MWGKCTAATRRITAAGYGPTFGLAIVSLVLWIDVAIGLWFAWPFAAGIGLVALSLFAAEATTKKTLPSAPREPR